MSYSPPFKTLLFDFFVNTQMMIDVLWPLLCKWQAKRADATSKGNEVKSKMKHPSDMPIPRF